jgi:hypothetical protein
MMIFLVIVLLSILPLLNSQDTITDPRDEPDYKVIDSPYLWVNVGFLTWGFISALILVSRLGNFCLVSYLVKRGKPIGWFSVFATASLVVSCAYRLFYIFLDGSHCTEYMHI